MLDGTPLKYDFDRHELLPYVPESARRILDVGCGSGAFGRLLRSGRDGLELWAVEPDGAAAQAARDGFDHVIVGEFPEPALPARGFDVVVFADVLEHLATPEHALAEAARLLAPGGCVLASMPNVRHWRDVLAPLLLRGTWTYTERGILDRTHLRFFTRSSMRALFEDNGWVVDVHDGINPSRRDKLASVLSGGRLDEFLYPQYVVVARPRAHAG